MNFTSVNKIFEKSIKENWDRPAISNYQGVTLHYRDVARRIAKLHIMFEECGLEKGDKVALCSRNQANWVVSFLAAMTYGAVPVPLMHEFKPSNINHLVNHSDAKILFVDEVIWEGLSELDMSGLQAIIQVNTFKLLYAANEKIAESREHLNELFGKYYPMEFSQESINYYEDSADELAIINYTSGTSGFSKGVMIPYRALWSNLDFAQKELGHEIKAGDKVLSMLPMAHMYGMSFEFIFEFMHGVHVNFLTKVASPTILMKALADVKPVIIVAVPLIIEKIVRKAILPRIQDPKVRLMLNIPILGDRIRKRICDKMTQVFGDNFYSIIIGGAALNKEIEQLLHDIGFRYSVGYGATECAPIITYADWSEQAVGSCGKNVIHQELMIDSPDPENIPGEILTRGLNVMLGYFKNEEATKATLDAEGWYHTGDLGVLDAKGNLYIKGRSKNMLLGPNGQNIYPEEIEDKLSNMTLVSECLVVQRDNKLVGLVYPDQEQIKNLNLSEADIESIMEQNRKELNPTLPSYAQLISIKVMDKEFEKTPKKSIKRFLYQN